MLNISPNWWQWWVHNISQDGDQAKKASTPQRFLFPPPALLPNFLVLAGGVVVVALLPLVSLIFSWLTLASVKALQLVWLYAKDICFSYLSVQLISGEEEFPCWPSLNMTKVMERFPQKYLLYCITLSLHAVRVPRKALHSSRHHSYNSFNNMNKWEFLSHLELDNFGATPRSAPVLDSKASLHSAQ